ncbi:MAG: ATP-binding protein [Alphaproteobacteria bacterium]|nr:ATP-binding protein [Alphaproteobacteria bacterium]
MKMEVSSNIQQVKTELDEKFFNIADPAFIFDLLRNKIYSNPVSAICREITCNALDAQREVGKGDTPIVISLPSYSDLYFKVKDCGPGISPDRMDNIFLNYGASTKRDTNNQIGGFGLGAKSPFAYTDSFTIVTNYNGISYNYCAFIDESKVGKLILLSETETSEQNGTEIIIPVKDSDVNNFITWTEFSTRHWDVKPTYLGKSVLYKQVNKSVSGTNWFAAYSTDTYSYEKKIKAIVGEIEYPLDGNALRTFANTDIMSMLGQDLYLQFQVGEVALAANRESVYLDAATKEAIKERLDFAKSEYKDRIISKIEALPSLWDAQIFVANELSSLCSNTSILGDITWKDIRVKGHMSGGKDFNVIHFHKKQNYAGFKLTKHTGSNIHFNEKSKLVIHDCGEVEPNPKHLKKFFEEDDSLQSINLIMPYDPNNLEDIIASYNLELMNVDYLSRFNTEVTAKKAFARTTVFQYQGGNNPFGMTSVKDIMANSKEKVLCFLRKDDFRNSREAYRQDKTNRVGSHLLREISKSNPNATIYGIDAETAPEKLKAIFKSYVMIDDVINRMVSSYTKEWYLEAIWLQGQENKCRSNFIKYTLEKIIPDFDNSNSILVKLHSMYAKIRDASTENREHINICNMLGHHPTTSEEHDQYEILKKKDEIDSIWKDVKEKYPLVTLLESAYSPDNYVDAVKEYISLIDNK